MGAKKPGRNRTRMQPQRFLTQEENYILQQGAAAFDEKVFGSADAISREQYLLRFRELAKETINKP